MPYFIKIITIGLSYPDNISASDAGALVPFFSVWLINI